MTGQDLIDAIQRCHMEHRLIDEEAGDNLTFSIAEFHNLDDEDDNVYVDYIIDLCTGEGRYHAWQSKLDVT